MNEPTGRASARSFHKQEGNVNTKRIPGGRVKSEFRMIGCPLCGWPVLKIAGEKLDTKLTMEIKCPGCKRLVTLEQKTLNNYLGERAIGARPKKEG